MDFTGFTVRYFTATSSGNFLFDRIVTDAVELLSGETPTGKEVRIGLTGITEENNWYFSFKNGKIYDPEGRWFGSYDNSFPSTISGNFSSEDYDYSLNNVLINTKGKKEDQDFNGWFVDCRSGASAEGGIYYATAPIATSFYMQSGFYQGGIWSGSFINDHTKPIVIRSGELFLPDSVLFSFEDDSGLQFNGGMNVVPAGGNRTVRITNTGSSNVTGWFTIGARVYTDYGFSDFEVSGMSVPLIDGYIINMLTPNIGQNVTSSPTGTGTFTYIFSTSYQTLAGERQTKPYIFELSYESGYTGVFHTITGITVTNGGGGFTSSPVIYVNPTGIGAPFASGYGVLNADVVSSVVLARTGAVTGATGDCYVSYEGGGGDSFVGGILWDDGYTKEFNPYVLGLTGFFGTGQTLCTGDISGFYGSDTMPTGNDFVSCTIGFSGHYDNLPLQYLMMLSGLRDTTDGLSTYSVSGLIYNNV